MNKYQNGKIYKITSKQTDDVYIGSTIQSLNDRFACHKFEFKTSNNSANHILKYDDVIITLIELYPVNSKLELHQRERYHIEKNDCVNKFIPTRSKKEYREATKYKRPVYREKYRADGRYKEKEKRYKKFKRSEFGQLCKMF